MVFAIARQYVKDEHVAEDVAQEAFLRAYRSLDGLREPGRVKTWLYALTRNAAIDWLRANRRKASSLDSIEEADMEAPTAPEPAGGDRLEKLKKVLESMRADYRELILLRYFDGLSYQEIAETLGMTVGAVGEKLSRVRDMIVTRCGL